MTAPKYSAEAALAPGASHAPSPPIGNRFTDRGDAIVAQGCDFWEWLSCAGTVAGCALSCAYKGTECFECFAQAGREVCYACV